MEGKKANIHQVIRKVILHVRKQERNVSTTELDESWRLIEKQIHATKKKKLHQRLLYAATYSSVAAILLCMFWLGKQFISYYHADDSALVDFALKMQAAPLQEDILLLIPGEKNIEVSDTDANIIYSQNGLVVVNSDTVNQIQPQKKKPEFNQLITPKGKRTQLTLPDGTHLWVNSGTRVIYPTHFERDQREIYVEGEVFLDVRRNEKAPFIVRTKDFQVQVLGTSFNISAYSSEKTSSVVLVEGSVNIKSHNQQQVKLAPGQLVNIHSDQLDTPQNVNVEPYICWIKNILMYTDDSLDKVFRKLNLYYGKEFVLDTEVERMQVSGKLDLKDKLEDVLHTISYSAPIEYKEVGDKIYVRKK